MLLWLYCHPVCLGSCFCTLMFNVLVSRGPLLHQLWLSFLFPSIHPSIPLSSHSFFRIYCGVVICVSYALIPRPSFEYEGLQTVHIRHWSPTFSVSEKEMGISQEVNKVLLEVNLDKV